VPGGGWEQAERERTWALVSARAEGISIRTLAAAAGLSPSRVHQIVAAADLDALDAALGELRAAGWPAPEHPDSGEDTELDGRYTIAGRLSDEVGWLRQCAGWLSHLDADRAPALPIWRRGRPGCGHGRRGGSRLRPRRRAAVAGGNAASQAGFTSSRSTRIGAAPFLLGLKLEKTENKPLN